MKSFAQMGKYTISPVVQLAGILTTSLLIMFFFYQSMGDVPIRDVYAPVTILTPQRLAEFGGLPAEVGVGMFLRAFPRFDPIRGDFIADITLWFLFDPRLISIERISEFAFERAVIVNRSTPYVRVIRNNVLVRYDLRVQQSVPFDYRDFPFDGHRLNLALVNYFLSPSEVIFTSSRGDLVINPDLDILGWQCVERRVTAGFGEERLNIQESRQDSAYPRVVFAFDFERAGSRHIVSIFVPLLLIFFIALLTFSFDPLSAAMASILSLSATAVTALIAYRFVIENMSPQVGYFMVSDYVFLMFLIACCIIFFINVFGAFVSALYKTVAAVFLHLFIILTFFFLI